MNITEAIVFHTQKGWKFLNTWSKNLPVDRRIQAISLFAFSFSIPLYYYRKEISTKIFGQISITQLFLKTAKNIPETLKNLINEEIIQSIFRTSQIEKNVSFDLEKEYSSQEWLGFLHSLSFDQLIKAAERILPSSEPYPISTTEEWFHKRLSNISTDLSRILQGIDRGVNFTGVIKDIREYPQGYAGILLNWILWAGYQNILSPFFYKSSKRGEKYISSFNKKFIDKSIHEPAIESLQSNLGLKNLQNNLPKIITGTLGAVIFYRLMQRELPRGVRDLRKDLANHKIPYRGLDFYQSSVPECSYKNICENILSFFFLPKTNKNQAIILSTANQNDDRTLVEMLIHTLAEMANCGRSELMYKPFPLWIDLPTLLNDSAGDPSLFKKKWDAILQYQKGNTILYLAKFSQLYTQIEYGEQTRKKSRYSNRSDDSLSYCLGYIIDSINLGEANCIFSASEFEKSLLSQDKEYFYFMSAFRMKPEDTEKFLKRHYCSSDRCIPKLSKKTIGVLMNIMESHHLEHQLPGSLMNIAQQSIRTAIAEQQTLKLQFPEANIAWEKIGNTLGHELNKAREHKEQLIERFSNIRQTDRSHPDLIPIAKELLLFEHIIIPLIYVKVEEELCEISDIPFQIPEHQLIPLMQQDYGELLYAALPSELKKWNELPAQMDLLFANREDPIRAICHALKTRRIAYHGRDDPLSILIFGPPGTGKSYLAKTIAAKVRLILNIEKDPDLSNAKNVLSIHLPHVNWKNDLNGFLEKIYLQIEKCRTSFIILEEIDKVPAEALDKLLQLLEDSPIKRSYGQLNKGNTTFIFTSNACMDELKKPLDTSLDKTKQFKIDQKLLEEEWLQNPSSGKEAFLNRINLSIPARALNTKSKEDYIVIFLEKQKKIYLQHHLELNFDPKVTQFFAQSKENLRKLKDQIEITLCNLLENQLDSFKNKKVLITVDSDNLVANEMIDR